MVCPLCDCLDWSSVEKNKDGVNVRVQCDNCKNIYETRFHSESLSYRLADVHRDGRNWEEIRRNYSPPTGW